MKSRNRLEDTAATVSEATALAEHIKQKIDNGSEPLTLAMGLIGLGLELLGNLTGRVGAARVMHSLSLAMLEPHSEETKPKSRH